VLEKRFIDLLAPDGQLNVGDSGLLHNSGQVGQRPGGRRAVCAMKRVSGSFSLSTTIEIPGEQAPDSGSNESTEKCPVTGRIRFFGSEQYSRKRHQ
jgi:hypothetical protein